MTVSSHSQDAWLELVRGLTGARRLEDGFRHVALGLGRVYGPGAVLWVGTQELAAGSYRVAGLYHLLRDDAGETVLEPVSELEGVTATGGYTGMLMGGGVPFVRADLHVLPDPLLDERLAACRSVMALPLWALDETVGWLFYFGAAHDAVGVEDLSRGVLLASLFSAQNLCIVDAGRLRRANDWIDRELDQIAGIQQALLPDAAPPVPGIRYAAGFHACRYAGGDYYDLMALPDAGGAAAGRWGVIIADAAGHGPGAAVEVAMFDAILRTYPGPSQGPAEVFGYANRHLFTRRIRGTFITAFAASYDPASGLLTYAGAGHPAALVRRSGGALLRLDGSTGIPLGVDREHIWNNAQLPMAPGDLLVLYSDGVTETPSPRGGRFGLERLEAVVRAGVPEPQALVGALEAALQAFREGGQADDDRTVVVVQLTAGGKV